MKRKLETRYFEDPNDEDNIIEVSKYFWPTKIYYPTPPWKKKPKYNWICYIASFRLYKQKVGQMEDLLNRVNPMFKFLS